MRLKGKQCLNTLNVCLRFSFLSLGFSHADLTEIFQWNLQINTTRVTAGCTYVHFLFMHIKTIVLEWNNFFPSQPADCEFPSELRQAAVFLQSFTVFCHGFGLSNVRLPVRFLYRCHHESATYM